MAYSDNHRAYNGSTYPPQQPYADNDNYYSYDNNQPHATYGQAGFNASEPGLAAYKDEPGYAAGTKERDTQFVAGVSANNFSTRALGPRSSKSLKRWRHEHQGNLWVGSSKLRCCGRFFCCSIMMFLFFLVGIVLSLLLWIRPPNVEIGSIHLANSSNAVNFESNGLAVTLDVPIVVNNPNFFSVTFDTIHADIFYPINNTEVGQSNLYKLKIDSNKQTNFSLPFTLNYTTSIDPKFKILTDIADHCGFGGGKTSQITVDYEITLDFKILFIPIKPIIKNSASFDCPFTLDDIEGLLKSVGLNIPGLDTLLKLLL
ncbi:hypothetical protein BC835DRAFT_1330417 [Cytidiella melzeri]|nr:hypothetical protein BC835DRAFT_1330417 [Cytidiella melzeri]